MANVSEFSIVTYLRKPGHCDGIKRPLGTRARLRRCQILASGGFHHGLEQG
jgi:hypothetical protein